MTHFFCITDQIQGKYYVKVRVWLCPHKVLIVSVRNWNGDVHTVKRMIVVEHSFHKFAAEKVTPYNSGLVQIWGLAGITEAVGGREGCNVMQNFARGWNAAGFCGRRIGGNRGLSNKLFGSICTSAFPTRRRTQNTPHLEAWVENH